MNNNQIILATSILGLITYIYRFSFISHQGRQIAEKIPSSFLQLLAPATFAAIIANHLASHKGSAEDLKLKSIVLILSVLVAAKTKSIMATLIFGLVLLYSLQKLV